MKKAFGIAGILVVLVGFSAWQINNGGGGSAGTCGAPNCTITGTISSYNGIATVGNGVPQLVAKVDSTGLTANQAASTVYAVPSSGAGLYRFDCYTVITTAATSSTLPTCNAIYTDNETSTVETLFSGNGGATGVPTTNTVGTIGATQGSALVGYLLLNVKASTNIQYQTQDYASSPANTMAYSVHVRLEYLSP